MSFRISFSDNDVFNIGFGAEESFTAEFDSVIANDKYHGTYEFTPSAEQQTVRTAGLVLEEDITIAPIPDNYGLITWDGSVITVS